MLILGKYTFYILWAYGVAYGVLGILFLKSIFSSCKIHKKYQKIQEELVLLGFQDVNKKTRVEERSV